MCAVNCLMAKNIDNFTGRNHGCVQLFMRGDMSQVQGNSVDRVHSTGSVRSHILYALITSSKLATGPFYYSRDWAPIYWIRGYFQKLHLASASHPITRCATSVLHMCTINGTFFPHVYATETAYPIYCPSLAKLFSTKFMKYSHAPNLNSHAMNVNFICHYNYIDQLCSHHIMF